MSGSCQAAGKQADACDYNAGFRAGNGCLEVFGKPSIGPNDASLRSTTQRRGSALIGENLDV
jgi:hypothetical protein